MTAVQRRVLWVDEDQGEFPVVAWIVAQCGATVQSAFTVEEGLRILNEHRTTKQPLVIVLDAIVRSALAERTRDRYSGLRLWGELKPADKRRTLMLSVVPYDVIKTATCIPRAQFFSKLDLDSHLGEFEERLREMLGDRED